jgi:PAS domain S-box-containing protein
MEDNYKQLIKNAPFGFARHKIILNDAGKPIDYQFIDVNSFFEKLTGLKAEKIINKLVTEVIPGITQEKFDWIASYGEIALNGGTKEFEQYSDGLKRWYKVYVYSPEKYYFSTFITDITNEMQLIDISKVFLNHESSIIDYHQITNFLQSISGAKYVIFNLFEENSKDFKTVAISGINEHISKASGILGFKIIGKKWQYDPVLAEKIKDQKITRFNKLHDLTGIVLSSKIIMLLEKTFQVGEVVVVKIMKADLPYGNFTLIMPEGQCLKNDLQIEIFANQVGLFLYRKKAEDALREKEEQYRFMFANNIQPMFIFDFESLAIIEANNAANHLYSYSEMDFLSMTLKDIHFAEDIPALIKEIKKDHIAFKTNKEWRHHKKNGEIVFVEIISHNIFVNNRKAIHVLVHDITERKRQEETNRKINEVQSFLAHNSGTDPDMGFFASLAQFLAGALEADFVCIDRLEGDGLNARTLSVWNNGQFEDNIVYALKDTPCGDVVGKTVCCFPASVCHFFPKDTVLQDLKAESYVGVTLWSHTGRPIGLIAVIKQKPLENQQLAEDLLKLVADRAAGELERMEAESALRESELNYRTLFKTSPSGILRMDENGIIIEANEAFLKTSLYNLDELIGSDVRILTSPEYTHKVSENIHHLLNGETLEEEVLSRRKDGSYRILLLRENAIILPNGRSGILSVSTDITERKHVEEKIKLQNTELQKINAEKDKFFSIIAHDLRSPFNSFLGLTQIMAEELQSLTMDQLQKFADSMRKSASNLFRLLENLLEWSQIQQGIIPFNPEVYNLQYIVNESMEMISDIAIKKQIEISMDIPADIQVLADSNILQTIIRNIVSNAVKFTQKGGHIYISAKYSSENNVLVSISDNGIGMNINLIANLFSLDVNTSRKGTDGELSSGLGLILCKEFIEKHGGKLWVESEEGKGSCFYFTISAVNKKKE